MGPTAGAADVLTRMAARRADAEEAERDVLRLAVHYAGQHPAPGVSEDDAVHGDRPLLLAGPGAPGVAEFAVAEFSAVLGLSTSSGRAFLGQALELRHRLPQLWTRLDDGEVTAWRARMVAERTVTLSEAGARYVDAQVAPLADRIGPVRLQRLVEQARLLADESVQDAALTSAERCTVIIDTEAAATGGVAYVDARLDVADALDLDRAIKVGAAALAAAGDRDPLELRRSRALGLIARAYLATADDAPRVPARPVQLYVHYAPESPLGRVGHATLENTHATVSIEQVAAWCAQPGAKVRITPVIDLADELSSVGYEPSAVLREQTVLRHRFCVFPHCRRAARTADLDHGIAFDSAAPPGGPPQTRSDNLAPLCREHHRLKTFSQWRYRHLAPGVLLWTSPDGRHYLRTPALTVAVSDPRLPVAV